MLRKNGRLTTLDLPNLYKGSIGFDNLMDKLEENFFSGSVQQTFPPYNIVKEDDNHYTISLAVAGFGREDISVYQDGHSLVIEGKIENTEEKNYYYKGISTRNFVRKFALADHVEIAGAEMKDGILNVNLELVVPEELKPKQIPIK